MFDVPVPLRLVLMSSRLMVYPPPPAKGGILVTNEDLHCLNDGEFLNDVIIDFYLKLVRLHNTHVCSGAV